jgi:hypothetical protein
MGSLFFTPPAIHYGELLQYIPIRHSPETDERGCHLISAIDVDSIRLRDPNRVGGTAGSAVERDIGDQTGIKAACNIPDP